MMLSFILQNRIHFKTRKNGFLSQLPETRGLKLFPELETLLWLESRVIDCDWSRVILWKTWLESIRVTIFLNVTRVGSSYQKLWHESSHWVESRYHWYKLRRVFTHAQKSAFLLIFARYLHSPLSLSDAVKWVLIFTVVS